MAKQQELVLNTGKLSGICGRLMCCLGFEYNEGGHDQASQPDDSAVSFTVEEDATPAEECWPAPEVTCCSAEPPAGAAVQTEKQGEQKKAEGFRKHKRRRRYRKRARKDE